MELNSATWRKSTFSGGNGGGCVEVGAAAGVIAVRDTKLPGTSPVLSFAPDAWRAFAAEVKNDSAVLLRHFQRPASCRARPLGRPRRPAASTWLIGSHKPN